QPVPQNAEETVTHDTIKLKYQLDTIAPLTDTTATIVDDEYADEPSEEDTIEQEYFLQKEYTGGLPDTLKLRRLGDKMIKTLREDKAFWYANESFKKKQANKKAINFTSHPIFQTVLWLVIIGGFVAFVILYLKNSNAGLFRNSSNIDDEKSEAETNDIFSINYQKEIDKAAGQSNYRLAVRLMFLRLLRDMSDKNIIQYKTDNTNFDYMIQLQATGLYPDFFRLARNYEYSWYGQFDIDKEKYSIIKNEFSHFERKINR
ncbi:MAG: hypothetical protein ACXWWC_15260, partial [Chitinophagaceae bacterium]